jgi:bleomycin hydrolase
MDQELNYSSIKSIVALCENDPKSIITSNAFQASNFKNLVMNNKVHDTLDHIFSNQISDDDKIEVIDQGNAGLCWMCAGITMCRRSIIKKMNLTKKFNLSLNYLLFWDKLERCNYFMNYVIENRNENLESFKERLHVPITDGGFWHTFADLVSKYGMVPDTLFKRRISSKSTGSLNELLKYKLREFASIILSPNIVPNQSYLLSDKDIEELRNAFMCTIVKILVQVIGNPVYPDTKFNWTYKTYDDQKTTLTGLTPMSFYKNYCGMDFNDYVVLVNDPRTRHPFERMYEMSSTYQITLDRSTLKTHHMMNLNNDEIIKLIMKQIDEKIPVWFACDVGKYSNHQLNVMDVDMYNYGLPFDTSFNGMSKADRIDFFESYPSHAMAIVGYDTSIDSDIKISEDVKDCKNNKDNKDGKDNKDSKGFGMKNNSNYSNIPSTNDNDNTTRMIKAKKRKRDTTATTDTQTKSINKKSKLSSNKISPDKKISTGGYPRGSSEDIYEEKLKHLIKFKVENSWGDIGNANGFYSMTTEWFKQHCFETVINKKFLTEKQKSILKTKPIKLKMSDPMSKLVCKSKI